MITVKSLTKGQVVIPVEIRRKFGIEPGTLLEVRAVDDHIELYPLPQDPVRALRGSLKGGSSLADELIHEHREEVEREEREIAESRRLRDK